MSFVRNNIMADFLRISYFFFTIYFLKSQPTHLEEITNEEFHRKMGYLHFGQFEIFEI